MRAYIGTSKAPNAVWSGYPKINKNTVSGFTTTTYGIGKISKTFAIGSVNTFDLRMKFTGPTTFTVAARVINWTGTVDSIQGPYIQVIPNRIAFVLYDGTKYFDIGYSTNVISKKEYFIQVLYKSDEYIKFLTKETADDQYVVRESILPANITILPRFTLTDFSIGGRSTDKYSGCVFNGSIDFSEFSLTINNEQVYDGLKDVHYVQAYLNEAGFISVVPDIGKTYV